MGKFISYILFYAIWLPICFLMVGVVMLWAILTTWINYIIFLLKNVGC